MKEMELNTVIELVKAGFTKDEIMQMEQPATQIPNTEPVQMEMDLPAPEAEPAPIPTQVTEPVSAPAPAPAPQPVHEENQTTLNDVLQSIAKLTSAVQANAIAQSVMPNSGVHAPTAEDMLAEIIRPTYGGKQ